MSAEISGCWYGVIVAVKVSLAVNPLLSTTVQVTLVVAEIVPLSFVAVPAATSTADALPNLTVHFEMLAPYLLVTLELLNVARIFE